MKEQLHNLEALYGEETEFLAPQCADTYTAGEEDVIIFPHLTGAVFHHRKELETIKVPIFVLTSSYGTVEMWDWEIVAYLRENTDLQIFTPYHVELGKVLFRAAAARKAMRYKKFVMFQDSPGEGMIGKMEIVKYLIMVCPEGYHGNEWRQYEKSRYSHCGLRDDQRDLSA